MDAETLDIEDRAALERYLSSNFAPAEEFAIREFEVLAGGVSSRTVRVLLAGGQEWVLKQALAKLRVAADWFSDPRRVHREALGMRVLAELTPPGSIPQLIFDDERHHVLAMEAVPKPHENWKTMLLAGEEWEPHYLQFGKLLAAIHGNSWRRRDELRSAFDDTSFFESLRLEPYYQYSATQEPRAAEFLRRLVEETRSSRWTLVHGDYSPKNVLVFEHRLVLLDHEVIHWGDPAFDVGFALTHLLSKHHHLHRSGPRRPGMTDIPVTWFHRGYAANLGDMPWYEDFKSRCARHTLGCLLARVVGRSPLEYLTSDERHRQREAVVRLIQDVPRDVPELIARFIREIESQE